MDNRAANAKPWLAYVWALSLIVVWGAVAAALKQPLWVTQSSKDLMAFGAVRGIDFNWTEAWRLVASQWLHVKFPHMLLNAAIIAIVGRAVEMRAGPVVLAAAGIIGGALGQLAVLWLQPQDIISGASQAAFALCAFVLANARLKSLAWPAAIVGIVIGLALDSVIGGHLQLKPGHLVGGLFGLAAGFAWKFAGVRQRVD